jgi:hypothetical protein
VPCYIVSTQPCNQEYSIEANCGIPRIAVMPFSSYREHKFNQCDARLFIINNLCGYYDRNLSTIQLVGDNVDTSPLVKMGHNPSNRSRVISNKCLVKICQFVWERKLKNPSYYYSYMYRIIYGKVEINLLANHYSLIGM